MIDLLNLLRDHGDADATRAVCEQALATGSTEAGFALTVLGQILREHGDTSGARAAFHQAIDAGNTDALADLTGLLRDQRDIPGLHAARQQALDHGDRHAADTALQSLAWVHHQEHNDQAARAALLQRLREATDQQSRRHALADLRQHHRRTTPGPS